MLDLILWSIERRSHAVPHVADEGLSPLAGLNVIPKRSFLSEYSSRVGRQQISGPQLNLMSAASSVANAWARVKDARAPLPAALPEGWPSSACAGGADAGRGGGRMSNRLRSRRPRCRCPGRGERTEARGIVRSGAGARSRCLSRSPSRHLGARPQRGYGARHRHGSVPRSSHVRDSSARPPKIVAPSTLPFDFALRLRLPVSGFCFFGCPHRGGAATQSSGHIEKIDLWNQYHIWAAMPTTFASYGLSGCPTALGDINPALGIRGPNTWPWESLAYV